MQRNILFVLGKDVHNKGTYKIYKECIRRGFYADVYATTFEDNHTMLFSRDGIVINDIKELDEKKIEKYDYIFSAVPLYDKFLFRETHKYIFLNPSTHFDEVYFSGDFIFTTRDLSLPLVKGECWPIEKLNYCKSLPAMATGGASLERKNIEKQTKTNIILFVDAGHFPFGTKKKLAEYIIQIANYCPTHVVRVKPRYLPSDKNTTHLNKENIYDYLKLEEKLPPNLELVMEHTDFAEEIEKAELIICPEGTTSYEEVILSGKKLIIFTGFPTNENMLWPKNRIELFNKVPENLCNRIYYKDIFRYLPDGIQANPDDLNKTLYKCTEVVIGIVDAMEYIYMNYISKNIFPNCQYYKVDNYHYTMKKDENTDWSYIKRRRYKTLLYDIASQKISRLCLKLDCNRIIDFIEDSRRQLNEQAIDTEIEKLNDVLNEVYIENKENMMGSSYSQSLLCLAYFKQNRFNEFQPAEIKCKAYYAYCVAKIKFDSGDYRGTLKHINEYFDDVERNLYEISYADDEGVKAMAHYYKGAALFHLERLQDAKIHLEICDKAWNGKHKKSAEYLHLLAEKASSQENI